MIFDRFDTYQMVDSAVNIGDLSYSCYGKLYNITIKINEIDNPDYMEITHRYDFYKFFP